MIKKYEILKKIEEEKIVAIIRIDDADKAANCFEALYQGGIGVVEITFTIPYVHVMLAEMTKKYGDKMLIGAGTVLDTETARLAILSGAKFLVSPTLNVEVIKMANRYGIPCFTGVNTPTEALTAMEYGCDVVKVFPASQFTYGVIKDLKGPLPNINVMPTGGVSLSNIKDWLNAGAIACGVGGELVKGAKTGDYKSITETAKKFKEAIK